MGIRKIRPYPLGLHGHARALALLALCGGCNAIFGIEPPEHADDAVAGTGAGNTAGRGTTGGNAALAGGASVDGNAGNGSLTGGVTNGGSHASVAGAGGAAESAPLCGNGTLDPGEKCDDQNTSAGDGCSRTCRIEAGFSCAQGEPTVCIAKCGDGFVVGPEAMAGGCDDSGADPGDGCSKACKVEAGYVCSGVPSVCAKTCGDDMLSTGESCEDGNAATGDGCAACQVEPGYSCDNVLLPSKCADINECATGGGNDCDVQAACTNTAGSFSCKCKAGWTGDGVTCNRPSCVGLANTCGASDDCCLALTVAGGTFTMGTSTAGTIATFALDKHEVTVGRFRNFVNAYAGHPANGAGAHPLISGSGWQSPAWDGSIAADKAALAEAVHCSATYQTWDATGTNDFLPMNCVNWFEAFAFCAWDGARLPTEAEWEYTATGGGDNRSYPWGNNPVPDNTQATEQYANYNCLGDGSAPGTCAFGDILPVGSKPWGSGKWEQVDLAGSMWEWNLDWYATLPASCVNCGVVASGSNRVSRGGGWDSLDTLLARTYRRSGPPGDRSYSVGFRCARSP